MEYGVALVRKEEARGERVRNVENGCEKIKNEKGLEQSERVRK